MKTMKPLQSILAAALSLALLAAPGYAQAPETQPQPTATASKPTPAPRPKAKADPISTQAKAVLVAPATYKPGRPIALEASASVGTEFQWRISPSEQFLGVLDGRKQAITFTDDVRPFAVELLVIQRTGNTIASVDSAVAIVVPDGSLPPVVVDPDVPPVNPPTTPTTPTTPATAVTYVYEKDDGPIPSGVSAGLNRLNREKKVIATAFEDDTTDGDGQTPDQYKAALEFARKEGLPVLVVTAGDKVLWSLKSPQTEEQVVRAVP